MEEVILYKMKPQQMEPDRFMELARRFELDGKLLITDEALAIQRENRAMAYAQPCGKMGGLLFYTDQRRGMAEPVEKTLDPGEAESFARDFLSLFPLFAGRQVEGRMRFSYDLRAYTSDAVTYDGKERRRSPIKTEIASRFTLNGIEVAGPRAKVRMVFKDEPRPIYMHIGLWERLEQYEERELVSRDEVLKALQLSLGERQNGTARRKTSRRRAFQVADVRLAYFADEYSGGPDLLAPYYFVEVEYEDRKVLEKGAQGPRQLLRLPAYR